MVGCDIAPGFVVVNRERAFVTLGSPVILGVYVMAVNSDMTININNIKHFKLYIEEK